MVLKAVWFTDSKSATGERPKVQQRAASAAVNPLSGLGYDFSQEPSTSLTLLLLLFPSSAWAGSMLNPICLHCKLPALISRKLHKDQWLEKQQLERESLTVLKGISAQTHCPLTTLTPVLSLSFSLPSSPPPAGDQSRQQHLRGNRGQEGKSHSFLFVIFQNTRNPWQATTCWKHVWPRWFKGGSPTLIDKHIFKCSWWIPL